MLALCTVIFSIALAYGQSFELKTNNDGPWGDWKARETCPDGQFARGISLYVVPEQGAETWFQKNDDWAATLIGLRCSHNSCDMSPPPEFSHPGTDNGWWRDVVCPCPGFITAFRQKVEPPQGDGDDTALNSVQIRCSDGTVLEPSNGGRWGNWGAWSNACPSPGWYVNGLMRKNEGLNPDNTGLNAVRMYCAMQKSEKKCETRVPIYRYWAGSIGDHFYTRDLSELGEGNGVYSYEGIGFYLVEAGCENAVPLYRYWKSSVSDHFYTTSSSEIGHTSVGESGNHGYVYEGIIGNCYPEAFKGDDMVPLYRYWKSSISDHFYTISLSEIGAGLEVGEVGKHGYIYEGIQCYVFASAV